MWTGGQQGTGQYTRNSGRDGSIVLERRADDGRWPAWQGLAGAVLRWSPRQKRVCKEIEFWRRRQKGERLP
jgi:hypothetical protein